MNFKKNWKRFFTVSRASEGFTLVELIVVIAILAILAGIAVPAYSGYIKKANKAADLQLLGAVNTAFAAACLESGHDVSDVAAANITRGNGTSTFALARTATNEAGWTVGGATVAFHEGQAPADFSDTFMRYYANPNATFKVITSLAWNPATGSFCDIADVSNSGGSVSYVYQGHAITVSAEAVTNLQNSTFGQEIGGEALLGEVSNLVNLVDTGDIDLEAMLEDDDYMYALASYIGVENADQLSREQLDQAIDAKTADLDEDQAANMMLNGLVYYAADRTTSMEEDEVTAFLTSGNVYGNLGTAQDERLANAAMAFGMYTAFVNSDQYTGSASDVQSNPSQALQTISGTGTYSEAFKTYMNSTQGQADLTAYLSAMSVINDSTGNDATLAVLANGFDNQELITLLTQAVGK